MSDKYYISPTKLPPRKDIRKGFKPSVGDLHINGCTYDENNNQVWNVVEVLRIVEPVTLRGIKKRIYSWIVTVRDIRTKKIYNTQVSLPLFKSPSYNGRRDLHGS